MLEGVITWAEIDLGAIAHNIRTFKQYVGNSVEIIAVVKANAYGHGASQVARAALEAGAKLLAVHRLTEGLDLRNAGINAPILIMGYTPPDGARMIADARLSPSVITLDFARALSKQAQGLGSLIPVHIKVDTGMNRHGLMPDELCDFVNELRFLPGIFLEGLFTQFATADWTDQRYAREQLHTFKGVLKNLCANGIKVPLVHAANSAAIFNLPEAHFNAVRPGLSMYGIAPSKEWAPPVDLHPALTLKSRICRVHDIPPGNAISYNRNYIATSPIRAALIPIGYGDGYGRIFSNCGSVLIRGQRARVLGLVCMDQIVVDVTDIPDIQLDDEVVIIGKQGDEAITVQELADLANTIPNELFTSLSSRIIRTYFMDGKPIPTAISERSHTETPQAI